MARRADPCVRFRLQAHSQAPEATARLAGGPVRHPGHEPTDKLEGTKPVIARGQAAPGPGPRTTVRSSQSFPLQLVGRGTSLRRSSLTVRIEAQKFIEDESGMRHASREHVNAARYLDLFAAEIDRELAPRRWPRLLVLDSKPFGLRAYGAATHGERWDPNARAWAVLVAVGRNDRTRRPKAWRIGFAGDERATSWLDFLGELEGNPEWVVADGIDGDQRPRSCSCSPMGM